MRRNTQEVYQAWLAGRAKNAADSIHTNGAVIHSYRTALVVKVRGVVVVNVTKYSPTTTRHQNGLLLALSGSGITYATIDDLPREWQRTDDGWRRLYARVEEVEAERRAWIAARRLATAAVEG